MGCLQRIEQHSAQPNSARSILQIVLRSGCAFLGNHCATAIAALPAAKRRPISGPAELLVQPARLIPLVAFALMWFTPGQAGAAAPAAATAQSTWLSPTALAMSNDGQRLYVACATAERVTLFDPRAREVVGDVSVPAFPLGLALTADARTLYVACAAPESTVCIIDTAKRMIVGRIPAGHTAMAPVLSPDGHTLYVCHRFNHEVAFIDLGSQKIVRRVNVPREPVALAVAPDGGFLLVANHLPAGLAASDVVAASVSVIDTTDGRVTKEIPLPNGSGLLRDVRVSPDGQHAVVTHQISRFHLPTSQIERGWINTNALSVIDARARQLINTVLLDNLDAGAANPWAAAWSADGRTLVVTHAGMHEVSVIDFPALLAKLAQCDASSSANVPDDLSFLTGLRQRIKLGEADRGPRAVALAGSRVFVGNYFSDTLSEIDLSIPTPRVASIRLHAPPEMSAARRGEFYFNDAGICFQGWQSCASCHSSDARVDGLNWDNLNDGIGNPKNTKSLVFSSLTPPSMWLGVRADAAVAVRAGIRNSLFTVQPETVAASLDEYLHSLRPMASPRLVRGALSTAARRGEKLFRSEIVGCIGCHVPPLFTDLKRHDVGTTGKFDQPADQFDTPELLEVWRTGPYLHDGSARTLHEVLTTRNRRDLHGKTSHLAAAEIDDLVEYILSL